MFPRSGIISSWHPWIILDRVVSWIELANSFVTLDNNIVLFGSSSLPHNTNNEYHGTMRNFNKMRVHSWSSTNPLLAARTQHVSSYIAFGAMSLAVWSLQSARF